MEYITISARSELHEWLRHLWFESETDDFMDFLHIWLSNQGCMLDRDEVEMTRHVEAADFPFKPKSATIFRIRYEHVL